MTEHEKPNLSQSPPKRTKPSPAEELSPIIGDPPPMPGILFPERELTANDFVVGALSGGA